jgi:hypothetical protein
MIATAILTLGLVSVLALFPAAIHTGKQVMDKSSAIVIAESVADAIRAGMRNQIRAVETNRGTNQYFVFRHDGVLDRVPNERSRERPDKDYFILLPRFAGGGRGALFSGRSERGRREKAFVRGKVFVYPESDPLRNGGGSATRADNDGDDFQGEFSNGQTYRDFVVEKTYSLGTLFPDLDAAEGDPLVLADQQIEPLKQYSYAFAIRNSFFDANLSPADGQYQPANRLYNVQVMIFRNFFAPAPRERHQDPVFEINFEVAL